MLKKDWDEIKSAFKAYFFSKNFNQKLVDALKLKIHGVVCLGMLIINSESEIEQIWKS